MSPKNQERNWTIRQSVVYSWVMMINPNHIVFMIYASARLYLAGMLSLMRLKSTMSTYLQEPTLISTVFEFGESSLQLSELLTLADFNTHDSSSPTNLEWPSLDSSNMTEPLEQHSLASNELTSPSNRSKTSQEHAAKESSLPVDSQNRRHPSQKCSLP